MSETYWKQQKTKEVEGSFFYATPLKVLYHDLHVTTVCPSSEYAEGDIS